MGESNTPVSTGCGDEGTTTLPGSGKRFPSLHCRPLVYCSQSIAVGKDAPGRLENAHKTGRLGKDR